MHGRLTGDELTRERASMHDADRLMAVPDHPRRMSPQTSVPSATGSASGALGAALVSDCGTAESTYSRAHILT